MPRINIEDELFKDQRFTDLVISLQSKDAALGALVSCWIVAQKYWKLNDNGIPKKEWLKQKLRMELITVGLADDRGEFVYVVGSRDHFAWLREKMESGKKGGAASSKSKDKSSSSAKRNQPSFSLSDSFSPSQSKSQSTSKDIAPAPSGPTATDLNREIWNAYAEAYALRYGTGPVRNATVNGQISQLGKRLGSEAPQVASAYVRHNDAFYVKTMHAIGPLLRDAEKLRTEWFTGNRVTGQKAREVERLQTSSDNWDKAAKIVDKHLGDNPEDRP